MQDNGDTSLGQPEWTGAAGQDFGTTVEAGAALLLAPTVADLTGGLTEGPAVWANHLTLDGTGNSTFGYAPLTVLSNDNLWSGPISLNSALSLTYQGSLGNTPLPANPVSVDFSGLTGTNPTIDVATTTAGSTTTDDVETFTFGGAINGGTFKITVYDGLHMTGTTSAVSNTITGLASTARLSVRHGRFPAPASRSAARSPPAASARIPSPSTIPPAPAPPTSPSTSPSPPGLSPGALDPHTLITNIQNALALDPNFPQSPERSAALPWSARPSTSRQMRA